MNTDINIFIVLFLFLIISAISIFNCSSAILHIFKLDKSKSHFKKIQKAYSISQRLRFQHIRDYHNCKYHQPTLQRLLLLWNLYIVVFILDAILYVDVLILGKQYYEVFLFWAIKIKAYFLDIPFAIYSFIMSKHDKKHGGVTWRWEKDK